MFLSALPTRNKKQSRKTSAFLCTRQLQRKVLTVILLKNTNISCLSSHAFFFFFFLHLHLFMCTLSTRRGTRGAVGGGESGAARRVGEAAASAGVSGRRRHSEENKTPPETRNVTCPALPRAALSTRRVWCRSSKENVRKAAAPP